MIEKKNPSPTPPDVRIVEDEQTVDVRAWARTYVHVVLSLEGVALVPVVLPRAS